ncbi:MAG: Panacea domain-containing protein [Patescibacteria group bacterium]|nr:Panacea domain-containing protein [Patescibacteria group bacterium]
MTLNKPKYKNAILYFIKYCNNQYLGDTKLNKLLYYLDFINYRDRKKSVTGDFYVHNHYGPTPANLSSILSEMRDSKEIEVAEEAFRDSHATSFTIKKNLNERIFTSKEKELLKFICSEFLDWSTDKIVEQTHLEAPWFYSKPFEKVDYNYSSDIEFF